MIIIDDVLISDDIFQRRFVCNIEACQGACCWEGDYGAPLENEEIEKINQILDILLPYLPDKSISILNEVGIFQKFGKKQFKGTPLHKNGACIFLTDDKKSGTARCAFEVAYEDGLTDFKKPISCHLYPIRVVQNKEQGFEAWNYDQWDICNPACKLGNELNIPVFVFLKDAIIRAKGAEFYEQLEAYYHDYIE
ncbi:MAG TPA: DUF3109 family protein [Saprospiraceae bacterium]|nr:DUF3109 family protein [Saprospiraceae bacterium]HPQ20225.1 DUF3109 family protein [Saprospiraceae bacterium]HRX28151.1 DUF3109 family protein [Saprospiraceae bacterium]